MTISCRALRKNDLSELTDILNATDLFPADMLDDMVQGYLTQQSDDRWCVSLAGHTVVGFAFLEPERMTSGTWNMLALAVSPDHQGQGIGAALVGYAESTLIKAKARLMLVDTLDTEDFAPQRRFYTSCGYQKAAHIPDFYDRGAGKVTFTKILC